MSLLYRIGFALRETGQALERVGCRLQGINSFEEELPRLVSITNFGSLVPKVDSKAFVAPSAVVAGDVSVGGGSSVWYNCSIRGEVQPVSIGNGTNLQDGVVVGSLYESGSPTSVGNNVSVGHAATLSGCTIGDNCLIGMGAVLKKCQVEKGAIVAAGAVVEDGTHIPSGEVWGGNPATKIRSLKPEEAEYLKTLPAAYTREATQHMDILGALYKKLDQTAAGSS